MCGIAGVVDFGQGPIDLDGLACALELLHHRGPDDQGVWVEGGVALGHRRLSILDLSRLGHQPMLSRDGRYVIIFNGEIYNFKFLRQQLSGNWKSESDTEVLLEAYARWGPGCLSRLNGMFAFAIWDRHQRTLFAARDRLGVKPFYYSNEHNRFSFASRPNPLNALASHRQGLDPVAIRIFLEAGYIPSPYSAQIGIRKLPPAHYLTASATGVDIRRYWDFRNIPIDDSLASRKEDDLLDELDELTTACVQARLVSDVPLGAFLSGGIDSSLVVALMTKCSSSPVRTFTIGFDDPAYNESQHAAAVATHLGTDHHCEYLNVDDLLKLLPRFHEEYDEPFSDHSAFPTMAVSRLARQHVTVSLSGDGGDELFGGYHYYRIAKQIGRLFALGRFPRMMTSKMLRMVPRHDFKLLAAALNEKDIASSYAFIRSIAKDFSQLFVDPAPSDGPGLRDLFSADARTHARDISNADTAMRLDLGFVLPEGYLQKVDVGSMAFSLESRDPLLDYRLVEWAMRLPVQYKLRGGTNKYLLRKLAYRYVPQAILDRPKQGFGVPMERWLRGPLKQWALERLGESTLLDALGLNQKKVQELFKLHCSGERNAHPLLWAILVLIEFASRQRLPPMCRSAARLFSPSPS